MYPKLVFKIAQTPESLPEYVTSLMIAIQISLEYSIPPSPVPIVAAPVV